MRLHAAPLLLLVLAALACLTTSPVLAGASAVDTQSSSRSGSSTYRRLPLVKVRETGRGVAHNTNAGAALRKSQLEAAAADTKSHSDATRAGVDGKHETAEPQVAAAEADADGKAGGGHDADVPSPSKASEAVPPPQYSIFERQIQAERVRLQQHLMSIAGLSSKTPQTNDHMIQPPTLEEAAQIAAYLAASRWSDDGLAADQPQTGSGKRWPAPDEPHLDSKPARPHDHEDADDDASDADSLPESSSGIKTLDSGRGSDQPPASPDATAQRLLKNMKRAASKALGGRVLLDSHVWPDLSLRNEDGTPRLADPVADPDQPGSADGDFVYNLDGTLPVRDAPPEEADAVADAELSRNRSGWAVAEGQPSRGILISAGGTVLLTHVYIMLSVLRRNLKCELPVQIVHNLPREMDPDSRQILETKFSNVQVVDAGLLPYPDHHQIVPVEHYVNKAYAFYHCPFDQVLMLDADNLPLKDPSFLFDSPEFVEHGNLFWPDYGRNLPEAAYEMFGLRPPNQGPDRIMSTEAGQFLFDRRKHADVMEWVYFLNSYGPNGIYSKTWSDKETYALAFHLAGKPDAFRQMRPWPRAIFCRIGPDGDDDKRFMETAIMQHDAAGDPLFAHRIGPGKVDPLTDWECTVMKYVSVPLNADRAARLFAPDRGQHSYSEEMGQLVDDHAMQVTLDEARHSLEAAPDAEAQACARSSPRRFHLDCGYNATADSTPVPLIEFQDLELPSVHGVIRAAQRVYATIRPPIRSGAMFGNCCSSYQTDVGVLCPNMQMADNNPI